MNWILFVIAIIIALFIPSTQHMAVWILKVAGIFVGLIMAKIIIELILDALGIEFHSTDSSESTKCPMCHQISNGMTGSCCSNCGYDSHDYSC